MNHDQRRDCKECMFGENGICVLSGDITNKRRCIPSERFPKALKQWIIENPES